MNVRVSSGIVISPLLLLSFMSITLYSALWDIVRPLGIIPLAVLLSIIVLSIFFNSSKNKLLHISKPYTFFFVIVVSYSVLSYFNTFYVESKLFYEPKIILQQAVGFLVFPVIALFFTLFFYSDPVLLSRYKTIIWIFISCYLIFSIVGVFYSDLYKTALEYFTIGTLINAEMIFLFLCVFLIFNFIPKLSLQVFSLLFLLLFTHSFQSTIAVLIAFPLLFVNSRLFLSLFTLGLLLVVPLSLFFPVVLFEFDPNTGLRSMFWLSGLQDFIDTYGVGIGFGTEALQAQYYAVYRELAILDVESQYERFMTTGMHNSFFDMLQRLGILGFLAFSWIVIASFQYLLKRGMLAFDAWVACIFLLTLSVNVALSINIIFGTSMLIGWLNARTLTLSERDGVI